MRNQKHLFSLQEDIHYLNCAYKAPLLKSCEVAATKALKDDRNPIGRTPEHFFKDLGIIKSEFSKIVKCNPSQVAIIRSLTDRNLQLPPKRVPPPLVTY